MLKETWQEHSGCPDSVVSHMATYSWLEKFPTSWNRTQARKEVMVKPEGPGEVIRGGRLGPFAVDIIQQQAAGETEGAIPIINNLSPTTSCVRMAGSRTTSYTYHVKHAHQV